MRASWRLVVFGVLAFAAITMAQSNSRNLAMVNGEAVTEEEVARVAGGRIRQLTEMHQIRPQQDHVFEREKLAIRWTALNTLISRILVRMEATKQNISEDQLIANEVDNRLEPITPAIVEAFLETNKERMPYTRGLSRREALSQVRAYLVATALREQREAYMEQLSKQYGVVTYLDPLRMEVATDGYPSQGTASAPVTIIEFSDFECPNCAALTSTLKSIRDSYGDKVRLVYRHFPLGHIHMNALKAAEASLCAQEQQHFWEFHDVLFGNPNELTDDALKRTAVGLKLDAAAFNACLDSGKHKVDVDKEIDEGYKVGVKSTPTIFINGRMFVGKRELAEIRKIVDDELARVRVH